MAKIISTDDFGGDFPYEKVIAHGGNCTHQRRLLQDAANSLNEICPEGPLFYKVVDNDYECKQGFAP